MSAGGPASTPRPAPHNRADYPHVAPITTRWADNDVYGHINNVTYYSFFDTAVNRFLIENGVLDIETGAVIGLVVETQCSYFAPVSFPQSVEAGIRVRRRGTSSVAYDVAIFADGAAQAAAQGYFIHVYVDRESRRPVPLPEDFQNLLATLMSS